MPTPAATTALQVGNPALSTVSRQPQTSAVPAGAQAPFVRMSRKAHVQGFIVSGQAFGALITQPLKAVGGYLRGLMLTVAATGGTGAAAVYSADAPWNVIQSLLFRDPLGQPIIQCDGYGLFLIQLFSGQVAETQLQDPTKLPSYVAPATTGNFTFRLYVPLELDTAGYCALASLNASAQPTLTIQLNPSATVYTTPPTTIPTMTITVDQLFWAAPVANPQLAPPGVGSSAQWSQAQASQQIPTASFVRATLPRVGTYVHTLCAVLRDNTGARVDSFPTGDLTMYVDGVPVEIEGISVRRDKMFHHFGIPFGGGAWPANLNGVLAYTFRDSVMTCVTEADTHDLLLPTTPATLLEIAGTFQTIASSPGQLSIYTGELYPVDGIPYTHLAY